MSERKELRVGIFGLGRGGAFVGNSIANGGKIVAFCEKREEELFGLKEIYGEDTGVYTDFDEFINHPGLDVVFLANYFNEHAMYAIKALKKNVNVISECISNVTMAEAVALVRADRESTAMYQMLENYPFFKETLELNKVYKSGILGKALYCEGEYNHPILIDGKPKKTNYIRPTEHHWRNYLPRTYYLTHSLAPLMYMTGAAPKRVTVMPVYFPQGDDMAGPAVKDRAAIITTLNDDDSVFRVTGCSGLGGGGSYYRLGCDKGHIETVRGDDERIKIIFDHERVPEGEKPIKEYYADWSEGNREELDAMSHGGSDYFAVRECFAAIRGEKEPIFDVHFSTTMSSVAILGLRSLLQNGVPYDIPDFHLEENLKKYENDHATPFYDSFGGVPTIPCSSHSEIE